MESEQSEHLYTVLFDERQESWYVTSGSSARICLSRVSLQHLVSLYNDIHRGAQLTLIDRKSMEFLYEDGMGYVVMDPETFDQVTIPGDLIGDQKVYLQPNIELQVAFFEGTPLTVELPVTVELTVVDTPPVVKGATATNQLKDAECEGGARVRVPPFVDNGTVIKVDTRSGEYLSRV